MDTECKNIIYWCWNILFYKPNYYLELLKAVSDLTNDVSIQKDRNVKNSFSKLSSALESQGALSYKQLLIPLKLIKIH